MVLTDREVRSAKAQAEIYMLFDAEGLFLRVTPTGLKAWRFRRKIAGKEKLDTLGRYPAMSLAQARVARDHMRDPIAMVTPLVTLDDLRVVTRRWHNRQVPLWKPHHAAEVLASLEREVFPDLGCLPIDTITAPLILTTLRKVEVRGAVDLAHRLRQRLSGVFAFAVAEGIIVHNPAAGITAALRPMVKGGHRKAVTTLALAQETLQRVEAVPAHPITRLALRLLALTAVRPGEIRGALWAEFAEDTWTVPAARMKTTTARAAFTPDHIIPLSKQAVEVVEAARTLSGKGALVFPSEKNVRTPLSENAIGFLMNRAGFAGRQTAHGWRATFSSLMNEKSPADRDVIEAMLAHVQKDAVAAAYNRTSYAARRREIAQEWADMLCVGVLPAMELLDLPRR